MKHMTTQKIALAASITCILISTANAATSITFEEVNLGTQGYINNVPYSADGATFSNSYSSGASWEAWSGFAISNRTNKITPGFGNQYSSYTGGGAGSSANFAVGYWDAAFNPTGTRINFVTSTNLIGMGADFTNTTYTALDMINGTPGVSKKFGGVTGNDPDYLRLTLTGYLNNSVTGSAEIYLADYRFDDNTQDDILDTWKYVDFSDLGTVDEIRFTMTSTDNGMFGINTPSYFAMDNLVPEPSSLALCAVAGGFLLRRRRVGKTA